MPRSRIITAREEGLLRRIYESPDDDAPRLVYADLLSECGDPHGELIQLQCALSKIDSDHESYTRMKRRERVLLAEHGPVIVARARKAAPKLTFEIRRGFVEGASGEADELAKSGVKAIALEPLLSRFTVMANRRISESSPLAKFGGSAVFERAHSLTITSYAKRSVPLRFLEAASSTKVAAALREVTLDNIGVSKADIEALVELPHFANLRLLSLTMCRVGKDALLSLRAMRSVLTHLSLSSYHAGERLAQALAAAPGLGALEQLAIPNNGIGGRGLQALVETGRLATVTDLDLRSNDLSAADVESLFDGGTLKNVRRLLLGGNKLGSVTAKRIAAWPSSRQIEKLHLGDAGIGDDGAKALAASPNLVNLRSLVLSETKLSPKTVKALLDSKGLSRARLYVGDRFLARA